MRQLKWIYAVFKFKGFHFWHLTLLHSERTKLYRVLAVLSAIGLIKVSDICKQRCANNIGSDQAGLSLCCSHTLTTTVFVQCSISSVGSMLAGNLTFLGSYPLAKEIFSTVHGVPSPVCLSLSPSHCPDVTEILLKRV